MIPFTMNIASNLLSVKKEIPDGVKLIAVSKYHEVPHIQEAYEAGQRIFGESKAQDVVQKYESLPKDIQWHFIGHLQTNKIKYIAPFVSLIHSIDSFKLLEAVNKEALKNHRIIPCLLQLHIAEEETKFGLDYEECNELLSSESFKTLHNIRINGLMGMATFTNNSEQIRKEFSHLREIFQTIKSSFFQNDSNFSELSMGMSDDFAIAIEEGSTMVRIGSRIFGERT